jgi:hypothetical protein
MAVPGATAVPVEPEAMVATVESVAKAALARGEQ